MTVWRVAVVGVALLSPPAARLLCVIAAHADRVEWDRLDLEDAR